MFAKTEVELDGESDHIRSRETNLGNLVADALAWGAREAGEPVDAAVINGGSIRASIPQGGITKKMIRTVLPFGNTLSIVKVTGAELLELWSVHLLHPHRHRRFPPGQRHHLHGGYHQGL